mgnify:CR=1 FL=1
MAITLSNEFKEQMGRANPEPVVQIAIQTVAPSAYSFYVHNGYNGVDSTIEGDPILLSVTNVSNSLDAVTRKNQISSIQFEVIDDGYIRTLAESYKFFNSYVLVRLGAADMVTTDWCPLFFGRISRTWSEQGAITFEATDYEDFTLKQTNFRTYFNKHPLEVLLQSLQDAGIPSARIDSTSFAFDAVSTSSHYVFSSYTGNIYGEPEKAIYDPNYLRNGDYNDEIYLDGKHTNLAPGTINTGSMGITSTTLLVVRTNKFLAEYLEMTRSALRADVSNTKLKMVKPLKTDSVAKHFTTDEYTDFEMDNSTVIFNRVVVRVGVGEGAFELRFKDTNSVNAFGEHEYETETAYFSAASEIKAQDYAVYVASSFTAIQARSVGINGFCGTRNLHAGSQVTADKITTDNPSYSLFLKGIHRGTSAITEPNPEIRSLNWAFDEEGSQDTMYEGLGKIQLNGLSHISGSSAPTNNEGYLWHDITVPYNFATDLLDRFSNGAPKIKFTTGLDNIHLELGDLISIDNDWFLYSELSLNGLDSTVKFEVTKKEVSLTGSSIGVDYEAVYITKDSPPSIDIDWIPTLDVVLSPINKGGLIGQFTEMSSANTLESGCSVTATTGLGYQINPGRMLAGGLGALLQDAQTFTATANKHSYIGIDSVSGNVLINEVATSADEPELAPGEIRIGKVISGASSVSSVVDLRQFGAITAKQLNRELLAPADGVLWNGGFEDWADPGSAPVAWVNTGDGVPVTDFAKETSVVHSGGVSLKMKDTGNSLVFFSGFIPIDSSQPYRASLWARQTGSVTMRSDVFWYTSAKVAASTSSASITNAACAANNTWENRSTILTPGSDVAYAKIKITRPLNPGADCYWDDVTLRPEAPSFRARAPLAGGSTSITKDTDTDLIFGTDIHDYGAVHDTSNGRFTAPSAGIYEINLTVQVTCTGGEASMIAGYLYKNGSKFAVALGGLHSAGAFSASVTVSSGPMELAAGDYITPGVHVGNRNATLAADPDDSYFSGRKIS